jgi:predicted DNA-binding transcriptional regulator AlpA
MSVQTDDISRWAGADKGLPTTPMNARTRARIDKALTARLEPSSAITPKGDELLGAEAVMDWLGVSEQWLADHRTRVEPIIPHVKLGSLIRYPRKAIQTWLDAQTITRPSWERAS